MPHRLCTDLLISFKTYEINQLAWYKVEELQSYGSFLTTRVIKGVYLTAPEADEEGYTQLGKLNFKLTFDAYF